MLGSIGKIALSMRQRFGHGFSTAYWRDFVRPRILNTEPIAGTTDHACEIHALTSAEDWLNLLWVLKSFYHASGERYALCLHDDGTLDDAASKLLMIHFPHARLIRRHEADLKVPPGLAQFPRCLEFRRTNHLAPKLFDFRHYLQSERMLLLDSDVLFFAEPAELLGRINSSDYTKNSVNADVSSAYTVTRKQAESAGVSLIDRFNSGLGLIHRESLQLDWIEKFLALPGILDHFWRVEQTLFALCSSRYGVELLPEEYSVRLSGNSDGLPVRHYVGAIRHLMYREGIKRLVRDGLLRKEML